MKKTIFSAQLVLIIAAMTFTWPLQRVDATSGQPTLLKRTISIQTRTFHRYWKNPKAAEPIYDTWCWAPIIKFRVGEPIKGGGQLYVEFDLPSGQPWLKYDMKTPRREDDVQDDITIENLDYDVLEKKAIVQVGAFPFRIKLKNALEGTDQVLFSGKIKVDTYTPNQKLAENKGKREFYIDQDWRLPMAFLWLDSSQNENCATLRTEIWIRNSDRPNLVAYLFYNGKQIAEDQSNHLEETLESTSQELPYRWTLNGFYLNVCGFKRDTSGLADNVFFLDQNPGEYEIKVVRDNQLVRSLKFTVGPDGKIVDNGVRDKNKLGGQRMLFPVQVLGTMDGNWNKLAWQTDAFYGSPLEGFAAR